MDEQQIDVKQLRVKQYLIQKHGLDGYTRLMEMITNNATITEISKQYGVSKQRMSHVLLVLLNMPYSQYLISRGVRRQGISREPHGK